MSQEQVVLKKQVALLRQCVDTFIAASNQKPFNTFKNYGNPQVKASLGKITDFIGKIQQYEKLLEVVTNSKTKTIIKSQNFNKKYNAAIGLTIKNKNFSIENEKICYEIIPAAVSANTGKSSEEIVNYCLKRLKEEKLPNLKSETSTTSSTNSADNQLIGQLNSQNEQLKKEVQMLKNTEKDMVRKDVTSHQEQINKLKRKVEDLEQQVKKYQSENENLKVNQTAKNTETITNNESKTTSQVPVQQPNNQDERQKFIQNFSSLTKEKIALQKMCINLEQQKGQLISKVRNLTLELQQKGNQIKVLKKEVQEQKQNQNLLKEEKKLLRKEIQETKSAPSKQVPNPQKEEQDNLKKIQSLIKEKQNMEKANIQIEKRFSQVNFQLKSEIQKRNQKEKEIKDSKNSIRTLEQNIVLLKQEKAVFRVNNEKLKFTNGEMKQRLEKVEELLRTKNSSENFMSKQI